MKKSLTILFLFLAVQIVAPIMALVLSNLDGLLNSDATALDLTNLDPVLLGEAMLIGNLVMIALLVLLKLVRPVKTLTKQKSNLSLVGWTLLGTTLFSMGLSLLISPLQLPDNGMMEVFQGMKNSVFCLLLLVIIGPLTEELVFREGILRSLWEKRWPAWCANLFVAIVFGLIHGNLLQAIPAMVIGFLLGLLYVRSGDLSLCFPAHALNNSLAALCLYFPEWEEEMVLSPTISISAGIVLCAAALSVFHFKVELTKHLSTPYKQ